MKKTFSQISVKKFLTLFILTTLFLCPVFSQEDDDEDPYKDIYYIAALALDFGIPTNGPSVLPVKPGLYFAYYSFDEQRTMGFHFDIDVLSFLNGDGESFILAGSSLIGPAFRFKNKCRFLVSPGLILGSEWYYSDDENLFNIYAGLGANAAIVFKSDFCLGLSVGYSPFCYVYRSSEGEKSSRLSQFVMAGIFFGYCIR